MPFLDEVERLFGTRDLYKALETERGADDKTIRRSYYRLSMRFHPDRATEDEATEKFQTLSRMNEILSDKERRAVYDETGEVDDESMPSDRDWTEYWRVLYKKISEEDVRAFHEGYKGSEEEMEDLKAAYLASEGDMDKIMESVLCASVLDDEERFREMLDGWIVKGDVPKYKVMRLRIVFIFYLLFIDIYNLVVCTVFLCYVFVSFTVYFCLQFIYFSLGSL